MPDFHIDIDGALRGLSAARDKVNRGIELYGQTAALKMEAYAKAHRPWHDRTASARQTLKGVSGWGEINADIKTFRTEERNKYGWLYDIQSVNIPDTANRGESFSIGITGNMPYLEWLELYHGKKYAILWPTVNALAAETLRGFAAMMNALH